MKQPTADYLIHWYSLEFASNPPTWDDETLTGLWDRYESLQEPSLAKTMRWLGFAQGAAYAHGLFSLDEIKSHSRDAVTRLEKEDAS